MKSLAITVDDVLHSIATCADHNTLMRMEDTCNCKKLESLGNIRRLTLVLKNK